MYYILNETNQIIAADEELLNLCGLSHIDELSLKIALGDIKFDLTSKSDLTITTDKSDETFATSKMSLSSMLGRLTLVNVQVEEVRTQESDEEEKELFDLVLDEKAEENIEKIEDSLNLISDDVETFDLGLEEKAEAAAMDDSPIVINIDKIAQEIGVSHEDYDTFLNEYIDTALGLEQDLQSTDEAKRSNAVGTLSHLSDVLQLPVIGDLIHNVSAESADGKREAVESFYAALSRLTTSAPSVTQEEEKMDLFDVGETAAATVAQEPVAAKSFGTLDLSEVKPIHFDFQLEEAASDLSLPVELIEEFVHDFIEQGHLETKNMLKAYEEGDLDKIQKIGHLLKGASSNLRIKDLSDTLYKIQFCEDSNDLEQLIKDYWGHFLSFEIQINALTK